MGYDLQGAIDAGVTTSEIAAHLKSKYSYDYAGAVKAGVTTPEITAHLQTNAPSALPRSVDANAPSALPRSVDANAPSAPPRSVDANAPSAPPRSVDAKGSFLRSPTGPTYLSQRKPTLRERLLDLREPEQTFRVPNSPTALFQIMGMRGPASDATALTHEVTGPRRQMIAKGMSEYLLEPGVPLLGQKMGKGRALFDLDVPESLSPGKLIPTSAPHVGVPPGKLIPTSAPHVGVPPKKIRDEVEGFFRPQSRMAKGEEFLAIRGRYLGTLDRFDRLVEKLVAPTRKWSPEVRKSAYRAAIQEIPLSALPEYARRPTQRIQSTLKIIGNKLVAQGEMSQKAFSELEGKYLKRAYLKHILPEKAFHAGSGGGLNRSFLKQRNNLTKAQQEAKGLIEDISVSAMHSLTPELHTVAQNTYFDALIKEPTMVHPNSRVVIPTAGGKSRRVPLGELDDLLETYGKILKHDPSNAPARAYYERLRTARDSVNIDAIPKDFVPLKGKRYGKLNGTYIHKTIQRDIQSLHVVSSGEGSKIVNALKTINDATMTGFKISKTALNIPTMAVNGISGAGQMMMGGMPPHEIIPYYIRAITEYMNEGISYNQMLRRGAFRGNFHTGELNEVLSQFKKLPKNPSITDIFSVFSKLTKFYGKIDDVSKLAMFMRIKEKGMPFSLTKRALFEGTKIDAAAKEAIEWGMDYSFAHPAVKIARKRLVPFATFRYKVLPLITKSLRDRPWVIGAMASLPYAITEAGKQYRNLSEDDWAKLRHDLPSFIEKSNTTAFFPFKDDKGNWGWVDLQKFMPWGDILSLGQAISELDAGKIYDNLGIGNPFLTLARAIPLTKGDSPLIDPYTQKPVYFAADSPGDKLLKTMEWFFTQMAPDMLSRRGMLGQTIRAVKKQPDRYGTVPSLGEALAKGVGANIKHPDPKQRRVEKKYKSREAKSSLRRLLRDPRNQGDAAYREEARARTRKKIRDIIGGR